MPQIQLGATLQTGRFIASAREQHLVADATTQRGGPGEGWAAAELLLAALGTCAAAVVQAQARESGGIETLPLRIHIHSEPDPGDSRRYAFISLEFLVPAAHVRQARKWIRTFQQTCPIYNTLAQGTHLRVRISSTRAQIQ
ncbi:MAG: OsmC family protein [Burkholderiaceae bacterium]|jgi:uncharacterized OsmC-like protein|nr:OsmC family protein [Burkholderiaceae bacterium]